MAIKSKDNEAFYREVDDELRRAQMTSFWERRGKLVIAGIVLLLAALAGFLWLQQRKETKAGEQGEQLIAAYDDIQAGKAKEAAPKLDALSKDGAPGYRAAALLTKANLALEAGKEAEAIAGLKAVAGNADLPQPYRDMALVRQTHLEFDKLPPADVIARLQALAKPESAWFGSAGEMVAVAHLKLNQKQPAARIFAALAKDEKVPASLRSRALQMAGSLGVDAIPEPAAETKE